MANISSGKVYYYSQCRDDKLVPPGVCPAHIQPLEFSFFFISDHFLFRLLRRNLYILKRHQIHIPTILEGSTRKTVRPSFFSMGRTCGYEPRTCGKLSRTCGRMPPHVPFRQNQTQNFQHLPHVRQWLPHVRRFPYFGPKFASKSHLLGNVSKTQGWIFSMLNHGSKHVIQGITYTI